MRITYAMIAQAVRTDVADDDARPSRNLMDEELLLLLHDAGMSNLGAELCFRKYESFCMRIAGRWSSDDRLARDTALDVLSHFIERETDPARASFKSGASIGAYLAVAIRNAFRDHYRRERRHDVSADEEERIESMAAAEPHPLHRLIVREQRAVVQRCLEQLTPAELHLLTLRYAEEPPPTLQQIGDVLGLVPSTVFYRIEKALLHLRQLLEQSGIHGADHAADE